MALPVYSARDVVIAFASTRIEGLAEDSGIVFSRDSAITEKEVGMDGRVAISYLPNETGTCTISLQQNSPSNLLLSGVLARQRATRRLYIGNLTINDPSGSTLAAFGRCHIMESPEGSLGASANGKTRDWVFFVEDFAWTATPEGNTLPDGVVARIEAGINSIESIATG